jgi:hypothetical protein
VPNALDDISLEEDFARQKMHGKKKTIQLVTEIKTAAKLSDVPRFAKLLIAGFTQGSPEQWMETTRVQKLIERLRSVELIRQLRIEINARNAGCLIDSAHFKALMEHLAVCEFMQEVFHEIDRRTYATKAAECSRPQFFRAVLRIVEIGHWAFNGRALRDVLKQPTKPPTQQKLVHWERQIRDLMDAGLIILSSAVARNPNGLDRSISDPELNELLEIAYLYEEMRESFDLYTYGGGIARIKRKSLVFKHSDQEADIAGAVSAERTHDKDNARQLLLSDFERRLRESFRFQPQWQFIDFLANNSRAVDAARAFIRARAADLDFELVDYFDIDTQIATKSGTFSIRELTRTWAFISCVAIAGNEWNGRKSETLFKSTAVVEIPRALLTRMLSKEFDITHRRARDLLQQFTTHLSSERVDLFYRPIVEIDSKSLLIPTPYVLGSRFERNILVFAVSESELDQKKKGFVPIRALRDSFREAEFASISDYKIVAEDRTVTDIDVIAYKNGVLFLGQAKIVIEPDSLYDRWKAEQKLNHAAAQLRLCIEYLDKIGKDILEKLSVQGEIKRIVPFIVSNTRQFTEKRFCGYPVVDVGYLDFVLGGATGTTIQPQRGHPRIGNWKSYIKGKYPSEDELEELILETFHRVQARGVVYSHALRTVGDRKIHLPMMRLGTPGESRMVFLD